MELRVCLLYTSGEFNTVGLEDIIDAFSRREAATVEAVSYTHLDVYKRQSLSHVRQQLPTLFLFIL